MGKPKQQPRVPPAPVSPELAMQRKAAALRSHVSRGIKSQEEVDAILKGMGMMVSPRIAPAVRVQRVHNGTDQGASVQIDEASGNQQLIRTAQRIALDSAPHLLERLVALARGAHRAAPAQQIQASRLLLEVAGLLAQANQPGASDAPLAHQTVAAMRQVVAAGEERIRQLQAELDGHAIDGQVGSRSTDPVHDEPPGQQDGGAEAGE